MADEEKKQPLHIALTSVKSSNVTGIGYDLASHTLAVRFASGGIYHFADVPADMVAQFNKAESKGSFFASHVRGQFDSIKVGSEPS